MRVEAVGREVARGACIVAAASGRTDAIEVNQECQTEQTRRKGMARRLAAW
ncbi:hypothetical protein [Benzoatithermus flavus]|uniref:Uncharacterized protein n=1 Tax=Benzoatithermus flavus TaxID=3108223 RepID=A0ABU8XQG9_9PROT